MTNTTSLKELINLIGHGENYSCNVSLRSNLDDNAVKELKQSQNSRTAEEIARVQKILQEEFQFPLPASSEQSNWSYATSVFEILIQIVNHLESSDEFPLAINEAKKVHIGVRKSIEYGLKPFLLGVATPIDTRLPFIVASTKVLLKFINGKFFNLICTRSDQHLVYTDVLSSIFLILCYADDDVKLQFEDRLQCLKEKISHADFFKILFLIQGGNNSRPNVDTKPQQILHKNLMECLYKAGSFSALCEALLPSVTSLDQDEEIVKKRLQSCAAISSIVGKRGLRKQFYHQFIDEIHRHLLAFIRSKKSHQLFYVDVGVQCWSKMYATQLGFIQRHINDLLFGLINKLASPNDLIAGAVLCEPIQFSEAIHLIHLSFCATGPSADTLQSEILTPYIPMFIQLHYLLTESQNKLLQNEILAIIIRCLSNRQKDDLNKIVEWVLYEEYDEHAKCIHPRVNMDRSIDGENEVIGFSINQVELKSDGSECDIDISAFLKPSTSLVNILKQSNHNTLIYNVFLHLLHMFSNNFTSLVQTDGSCELLGSERELSSAIEHKFRRKYTIVHALNELILFKPFHSQFAENSMDIISVLDKMLNQQIAHIEMVLRNNRGTIENETEEILIVILSIVGDFINRIQQDSLKTQLERTLRKLRSLLPSQLRHVIKKVDLILDPQSKSVDTTEFLEAKSILSDTSCEPYTKVYGIMNMIKLIKARDEETCLNAHIVLAIAMKLLKEEDSYIFLNCIKLLIGLVEILEETVLDTLVAEYHFDIDADTADMDFKLKIGETILKVTQGIGEMCYKYKDTLINCFLRGAHNKNDEFRASNMSNLGAIMQVVSYQIHHFFQEVMLLIQNTLECDKYVPTRRAAALVLTDLLRAMQNLEQYQEYLLPIYRNLKNISDGADDDLHIQIHARNGLEILRTKIKEAFTPDAKLEKTIRIANVKNDQQEIRYK